ncbi:hypothetical protein V2G26_017754 [Clonostachys chloroleuca]
MGADMAPGGQGSTPVLLMHEVCRMHLQGGEETKSRPLNPGRGAFVIGTCLHPPCLHEEVMGPIPHHVAFRPEVLSSYQ